jgi:hypothetical protein
LFSLLSFPIPRPEREGEELIGHILHVDRFGNLISDIREEDLPPRGIEVVVGGQTIRGLSPSYTQGGDLLALVGSRGHLEIAARNASAAALLGVGVGDRIKVGPAL